MKIPPAKKEDEQDSGDGKRGSDEVKGESNADREKQGSREKPASEIPSE